MENETIKTCFYQQHETAGAKFIPFAGVQMPLQYPRGVLKEHEWVRTRAGLFDVSHMGQALLKGADAAKNLSRLTPGNFIKLPELKCKYTVLTNEEGGIIDDLIVTRLDENTFYLVFNAARIEQDTAWIHAHLQGDAVLENMPAQMPLIALQGPYAEDILVEVFSPHAHIREMGYMSGIKTHLMGAEVLITRTGYTGEDGFELSIKADKTTAQHIWLALVGHEDVWPIGLAARDSLRLEVGFPLYGHDLDETTTPIEAGLDWIVSKNHSGFIGAEKILTQQKQGAGKKRVGILLNEKGIAREGSKLFTGDGHEIGYLTSGGFSPTTKQSIGQGYVKAEAIQKDKIILVEVRNRRLRGRLHGLNFIHPRDAKPSA